MRRTRNIFLSSCEKWWQTRTTARGAERTDICIMQSGITGSTARRTGEHSVNVAKVSVRAHTHTQCTSTGGRHVLQKAPACTLWGIVRWLHWECLAVDWVFRRQWTGRFFVFELAFAICHTLINPHPAELQKDRLGFAFLTNLQEQKANIHLRCT